MANPEDRDVQIFKKLKAEYLRVVAWLAQTHPQYRS
jgi:hypothetical protein